MLSTALRSFSWSLALSGYLVIAYEKHVKSSHKVFNARADARTLEAIDINRCDMARQMGVLREAFKGLYNVGVNADMVNPRETTRTRPPNGDLRRGDSVSHEMH
jgi:hypothetical protein